MKKFNFVLSTALLSVGAYAVDITASKVSGDLSKVDAKSGVWKNAKFATIELYPQYTVGNNDKIATANLSKESKKTAQVAAITNGKQVAFLVRWLDASENIQRNDTQSYADGFALQFPKNVNDIKQLPYIGMGSDGRPVGVYLKKAYERFNEPNGVAKIEERLSANNLNLFNADLKKHQDNAQKAMKTDYTKTFVSEGFRSMTEVHGLKTAMTMTYSQGQWNGTLVRSLNDETSTLSSSSFPLALALWDGEKTHRDGAKLLSGWNVVVLKADNQAKLMSAEIHKTAKGDIVKGAEIVKNNCVACHSVPGNEAPAFFAPNLSSIGGQATYSYIKESILNPHAVVVPGYNRNAHPNTPWYNINDKGIRESTMPAGLIAEGQELEDAIAYLQTLKGDAK